MAAISQGEALSGRAGTGIRVKLLGAFGAMALLGLVTCLVAVLRGEALLAVIATLSLIAVGPALFVGNHLVRRLDALTLEELCGRAHRTGVFGRSVQSADFEI